MSKTIDPLLVEQWQAARSAAFALEHQIMDRITYVIQVWWKAFGGALDTWYFYGAKQGTIGDLYLNISSNTISSIYTKSKKDPKNNDKYSMVIIDKFGGEWGWESEVPTRWLYEDCEDEIINGKALFEAKEIQKKADAKVKTSLQKKVDEALATQAKAKLTKEELKALKKVL